jgi:nucleoid-associated protein YgaU
METTQLKQFLKRLRLNPYFSLGIVLAIFVSLVAALTVLFSRTTTELTFATPTPTPESNVLTQLPETVELVETNGQWLPSGLTVTYIVQPGDSSWKIAEAFYGSGFNYVDIEEANQLPHNSTLTINQQLLIPAKPIKTMSADSVSVDLNPQTLTTNQSYTIQAGDSLWLIAERELDNPYRWTEIYVLNRDLIGNNPDLIYPETKLRLPS